MRDLYSVERSPRAGKKATLALAAMILSASCSNPEPRSVRASQGYTDDEKFITQFLDGGTIPNHTPADWSRKHIHGSADEHSARFYLDTTLPLSLGADADPAQGVDVPMLFFQAAHGSPDGFSAWKGDPVEIQNLRLGDGAGHGKLRYWWQCSCETFAHGPKTVSGHPDFANPLAADGSLDRVEFRNVYRRWGPVLGKDFRVACGMSTEAVCDPENADSAWDHKLNLGYDVADAFSEGFHNAEKKVVPLCIAIGGSDWDQSPLFDEEFTNQPNRFGSDYYYIQFRLTSLSIQAKSECDSELANGQGCPAAEAAPFVLVGLTNLRPPAKGASQAGPSDGGDSDFALLSALQASLSLATPPALASSELRSARIDSRSGAIYVKGSPVRPVDVDLGDEGYLAVARNAAKALGLAEDESAIAETTVVRNWIARTPRLGPPAAQHHRLKDVIVTFRRGLCIPGCGFRAVVGNGGHVKVQLNPDGSLVNASKVWRRQAPAEMQTVGAVAKAAPYAAALEEAFGQVGRSEYAVEREQFGYREDAGNVDQSRLGLSYRFLFRRRDESKTARDLPPRLVEVPAAPK